MKMVSPSAQLASDTRFIRWQPPECPFAIECSAEVLEEIRQRAMDAFFAVPHGGLEVGGVLFGVREPDGVRILQARALPCEHAFGPSFTLSEKDREHLQLLLASPEARTEGLVPLGWYHSHTRSNILLSARDLELQDRYFTQAQDVALVVRPHTFDPMRAGFFFREPGGIHSESSYQEFHVHPAAAAASLRAVAIRPNGIAQPLRAALRPASPRLRRPAPRWAWVALVALLLLALGISSAALYRHATPAPSAVSLMAYDLDGQLQIHWNGAAGRVRNAVFGSLEIADGGVKTLVNLEPVRLRSGSFSYARQNARVDLRLVMIQSDARAVEEYTTFLGRPPRSPVRDGAAESAALRQELQKRFAHASSSVPSTSCRLNSASSTIASPKTPPRHANHPPWSPGSPGNVDTQVRYRR